MIYDFKYWEIVPGRSIGPIQIGMTEEDVEKVIKIGDLIIPKASSTMEELRMLIGDCTKIEIRTGGNISVCRKGALSITVGSGDAGSKDQEIWLRVDPI